MKARFFVLILVFCVICAITNITECAFAEFDFDYFGVEPPGLEAKRFNPQINGLEGWQFDRIQFTPDGNECYFIMKSNDVRRVYLVAKRDGLWSEPEPVEFPDGATSIHGFSPDGNRLYFSAQPPDNFELSGVYVRTRTADGWSRGERLPEPVNRDHANRVIGMTVGAYEDLYFCTWRQPCLGKCDVWCAKNVDGTFPIAENLTVLNSPTSECMVICGPKDSYLVFYSWRPGGFGQADLYVSFPIADSWTVPRNLGPRVNTNQGEVPMTLSPDSKYMFFYSAGNTCWIETRAVLPDPNGTITNLRTGQKFGSIQLAIDYSNNGDEIVMEPGRYLEKIDLTGKNVLLCSADPNDPNVTEETILCGDDEGPIIALNNNTNACHIAGLTICGGSAGIICDAGVPCIYACQIIQNTGPGIEMLNGAEPCISNCIMAANKGKGINITPKAGRNRGVPPRPVITNCTITQNGREAIVGDAIVSNSILYFNNGEAGGSQIISESSIVAYSDIQGIYTGQGNIDADPFFAALGCRADGNDPDALWIDGDYHLQSNSPCIDAGNPDDPVGFEPAPNGDRINLGAYGGTAQASKSKEYLRFMWSTPAVFRTPESAVYDKKRDILYVSNFNIRGGFLQGDNQSFDEFISKVSMNGEIEQLEWITGLNAPTGMSIFEDKLYVVERNTLVEIDIDAGQIVNRYPISGARFVNDVVFDSSGIGYISDNDQNANVTIYRFVNGAVEPWINRDQMYRTNGLCLDQEMLVGSDYNSMYLKGIRLRDGQVENIAYLGVTAMAYDGLRVVDENSYIASDWTSMVCLVVKPGAVRQILDLSTMTPVAGSMVNCADIEYIPQKRLLIIPTFNDQRLLAYELLE